MGKKADQTLVEIWSSSKIDEYPVSAAWVESFCDKKLGGKWLENHTRISKYCLEIAKCGKRTVADPYDPMCKQ